MKQPEEIPGLVKKKEVFREDGREYLALEYLEGGNLKEHLKKHRTIPASEAKDLLLPAMKAAAGLHSKGIVHCDISPDNLLFAADGKLSLIDLGAAARKGGVRTEKRIKARICADGALSGKRKDRTMDGYLCVFVPCGMRW